MRRYIQTFLRHKVLLCAPLIVALVVGVGYEVRQPRKWMAGGTLWADAPIPNDSTIGSATTPTPASSQAIVLSELLHTRSFLTKVGQASPSAQFLATHSQPANDAVLGGIAKS